MHGNRADWKICKACRLNIKKSDDYSYLGSNQEFYHQRCTLPDEAPQWMKDKKLQTDTELVKECIELLTEIAYPYDIRGDNPISKSLAERLASEYIRKSNDTYEELEDWIQTFIDEGVKISE